MLFGKFWSYSCLSHESNLTENVSVLAVKFKEHPRQLLMTFFFRSEVAEISIAVALLRALWMVRRGWDWLLKMLTGKKRKKKILSFHLSASASYPHGPPSRFCRRWPRSANLQDSHGHIAFDTIRSGDGSGYQTREAATIAPVGGSSMETVPLFQFHPIVPNSPHRMDQVNVNYCFKLTSWLCLLVPILLILDCLQAGYLKAIL